MGRPLTSTQLSRKKRRIFLRVLAQTGKVTAAARSVGYTDTSYLQRLRRDDEEFAREWDVAVKSAANVLEEEAIRRAMEGVMEPIYYKGQCVGHKLNYSDQLMMFLMRGMDPERYRDGSRGARVNVAFGVAVLPMTAPNEQDWEKRALRMHSEQEPVIIDAKPVEEETRMVVRRGD